MVGAGRHFGHLPAFNSLRQFGLAACHRERGRLR